MTSDDRARTHNAPPRASGGDTSPAGPRAAVILIACIALSTGCVPGGGDTDRPAPSDAALPDALPMPTAWDALEACGLTGRFRPAPVDDIDTCAQRLLGRAEVLVIDRAQGQPRLRVGQLDLALTDAGGDCRFVAEGCTVDVDGGSSTTVSGTLEAGESGLAFEFGSTQVSNFTAIECAPSARLTATPESTDACGFNGRFTVDEMPALVAGACDLSWSTVAIEVAFEDGEGTVRWGQKLYEDVRFDVDGCRFEIDGGIVIYNGVRRTTGIAATVGADGLGITIEDALDGADMLGSTCVDARFEADALRAQPAEVDPFDELCEPLPRICGDGICAAEAGESCALCQADCGCDDGIRCAPLVDETWECIEPCETESDCPEAEQCVPDLGGSICLLSTGDAEVSAACESTRDCARGLQCAFRQCRAPCEGQADPMCPWCDRVQERFLCMPPCDTAQGECPVTLYCASDARWICSDDRPAGEGVCDPLNATPRCRARVDTAPEYGAPCDEQACRFGLQCIGVACAGSACDAAICSVQCRSDDDCADPLPRCDVDRVIGFGGEGFCVAEQP